METYRDKAISDIAQQVGMAEPNLSRIDSFQPLIDELAFDIEISEMVQDIKIAYKKEIEVGDLSMEAHEIIAGLIEVVGMLYTKRAGAHEE